MPKVYPTHGLTNGECIELWLDNIIQLRRTINKPRRGTPFICADQVIRAFGRPYVAKPTPPEIEEGEPKQCYDNALHLAMDYPERFTYVEGYVYCQDVPFPVQHAWVVDLDGRAVDNTPSWPWAERSAYFGIPMPKHVVIAAAVRNGSTSVFEADWLGKFYFVRKGWVDCVG